MKFDREGDVIQSLRNTVMSYKGKAFRIKDCYNSREGFVVVGYLIGSGEEVAVLTDDSNLDHVPPRLGYVNHEGQSYYVVRKPVRQYKRGLSEATVSPRWAASDNCLQQIIEDDYPSFLVAKKAIEKSLCKSIAFNKSFSISEKGISYRDMLVTGGDFQLLPDFEFLADTLEEAKRC